VHASSARVHVKGDCGSAKTVSGSIEVEGSVLGNAQTVSGDVRAEGGIFGSARTVSGDIRAGGKKKRGGPK
jgi:DUF4097 and DUF4098 domain-containing protein YvlB